MREGRPRRGSLAALGLAAAALVQGPHAVFAGESVTSEQLRRLSQQAASDPAAQRRLLDVDRVDGRPVDMRRALEGAEDEDLRSRLRVLSEASPASGPAPAVEVSPRDEAQRILEGRKFQPAPSIRPFRGILRRLGSWLSPIGKPLGRLWDALEDNRAALAAVFVAVIGAAALASAALIRRRSRAGVLRGQGARLRRAAQDPEALEREADLAEREGRLDWAIRLRFRAGLLRLDRAGIIAFRPALTTGELTRTLPSPRLKGLASAFEEIAYGGRPAVPDDLQAARTEWPRVLEEVGER